MCSHTVHRRVVPADQEDATKLQATGDEVEVDIIGTEPSEVTVLSELAAALNETPVRSKVRGPQLQPQASTRNGDRTSKNPSDSRRSDRPTLELLRDGRGWD